MRHSTVFTKPSMTQQSFRAQCSIPDIINRAKRTGMVPQNSKQPIWGDYTAVTFRSMQDQLLLAQNEFMALSPKIRRRFNNDPAELLQFISDPSNKTEAEFLGLIDKKQVSDLPGTVPPLDVTVPTDSAQSKTTLSEG